MIIPSLKKSQEIGSWSRVFWSILEGTEHPREILGTALIPPWCGAGAEEDCASVLHNINAAVQPSASFNCGT